MKRKKALLHPQSDRSRLAILVLHNALLLLLGGIAVLLACAPGVHIGGVSMFGGLPLLVIYCGTLHHHLSPGRREKTRPLSVFLIGLFQDILSGGVIGMWAFLYLLLHALLLTQPRNLLRFMESSALFSWFGFLFASLLFTLLYAFIGWLILGSALSPLGLAMQYCLTALLYPAVLLLRRRPPPAAVPARGGGG